MSFALSPEAVEELLSENYIAHLACSIDDKPYVVPITYYYDAPTNSLIGYTAEGHKVNILRQNPQVCVAVSEVDDLKHWKSVVLEGRFEEIKDMEAVNALHLLVTQLERLVNEKGKQHVTQIRDVARAKEEETKVIYRIHIEKKGGRFESGDLKAGV